MFRYAKYLRPLLVLTGVLVALLVLLPGGVQADESNSYHQINLVSDLPNIARFQDPNLVNPWGLSHSPTSPWWISDNGTGNATLYKGDGAALPLVVAIPPPSGGTGSGTPTGNVFNNVLGTNPGAFIVSANGKSGPSVFMFATEDGTIAGWSPSVDPTHAILAVDRSATGAVYKGLATGQLNGKPFIYATNFRAGAVEAFDAQFHMVGSFTDPALGRTCPLPNQCFAPFGIQNIQGKLFVTFALQKPDKHDDLAGPGNGFVDIFDTHGKLLHRFASQGTLNSPWGMALSPDDFGPFSHALLVGNFGDGRINAFNPSTGAFLGQVGGSDGTPITIDGLWGLAFGNGAQAGDTDELFFTAGINDEGDGLFGKVVTDD